MTKQQKEKDTVSKKNNVSEKKYLKNYCILALIFIACFGITIYFCKWYNVYKDFQKEIPIIRGSLLEIYSDDLEHFLVDNPNAIVYMCSSYSDECCEYEKKLKKYLAKNDVTDKLVYLNLTNEDMDDFLERFNKKYSNRNKLNKNYPAYVAFEDGIVENILQRTNHTPLTISKTQNFLELYLIEEVTSVKEDSEAVSIN